MGEKTILRFLTETSDMMQNILKLNQKDAKTELVTFKHFNTCDTYIKNTIWPLINGKDPYFSWN